MRAGLLALLLVGCATPEAAPPEPPVALYVHAIVHTVDPKWPRAEALAVRGERILAVGKSQALTHRYPRARTVDLGGACVVPGLIDAHGHLASLGSLMRHLDLRPTRSYEEMLARVQERVAQTPPGSWILGGRWDQASWGRKELPHHAPLSEVTPDHPVLLARVDGHAALANRRALDLAGIDADTEDPPGGEIVRDDAGEPTGILVDRAVALVEQVIPEGGGLPTGARWRSAQEACFRVGLTGVHDAGVSRGDLADLKRRYARGELKLRVHAMLADEPGIADHLARHPPRSNPRLSVRALKLYVDGAMGSRGAWLLEPYSDRAGHTGLNVMPVARLRRLAQVAADHGWQVCTHAIGDRANREALDAYAAALDRHPGADLRFRIEHAQCVSPPDLPRFAQLGVIASMQPTHATSDMRWAEDRVGAARLEGCYAWRCLLDSGARLAFGSDFPVENENPLRGIYAAVTRQDHAGRPDGGWRPDQILTRAEALRLFTLDAAYAGFQEKLLGSLTPGKLADFVVFDRALLGVPARELLAARVLRTVIGGETVYQASP
ncbi:MAG: amidohydrolase [Planctomycetota bacterium]|jgi:predicted amidohydrolase YtcJ